MSIDVNLDDLTALKWTFWAAKKRCDEVADDLGEVTWLLKLVEADEAAKKLGLLAAIDELQALKFQLTSMVGLRTTYAAIENEVVDQIDDLTESQGERWRRRAESAVDRAGEVMGDGGEVLLDAMNDAAVVHIRFSGGVAVAGLRYVNEAIRLNNHGVHKVLMSRLEPLYLQRGRIARIAGHRALSGESGKYLWAVLSSPVFPVVSRYLSERNRYGYAVPVAAPRTRELKRNPTIDQMYARMSTLEPGEIEIQPMRAKDGSVGYIVLVRGIELSGKTPNNERDAFIGLNTGSSGHSVAVRDALRKAGVPDGAKIVFAGHSQGGITAANLAANPSFNGPHGRYQVLGTVTAGSPVGGGKSPGNMLSVEDRSDFVPDLDGVEEKSDDERYVHRYGKESDGPRHGIDDYRPELRSEDFTERPEVRRWEDGVSDVLEGEPLAPQRFQTVEGTEPGKRLPNMVHDNVLGVW